MAEIPVSFVLEQLLQLVKGERNLLKGVHKEFRDIKFELDKIKGSLNKADRRAAAEGEIGDDDDDIRQSVKELREAAFRIEDLIDKYNFYIAQQHEPHLPECIACLQNFAYLIKTLIPRHRIASEIREMKASVRAISERMGRYVFEERSSGLTGTQDVKWHGMASLFIEEAEVVGFEGPRDELVGWLVNGAPQRTVISVVGMGGLGKTTLAMTAFKNHKVIHHFDFRVCITVSQSCTIEELLREMLRQLCEATKEPLSEGFYAMDWKSLVTKIRHYLQQKRYVVFFDDVWKVNFFDEIQLVVPDDKKGSRIMITTRNLNVAEFCKKSSIVFLHELQPLPPSKAWELFCKKAFHLEENRNCPEELKDISTDFVQKCEGLPLAIVCVAGLLSTKDKTISEWKTCYQDFSGELEKKNSHLTPLTRILALSYDDLPYYLKSCFLYFGIYPEDYSISCVRLTRQWVAEGFVKSEKRKPMEEVAGQYLTQLIHRNLVQVSQVNFDGKARSCRVHDVLRDVIIKKMEDSSFCHCVNEDDQSTSVGITRRLAIATSCDHVLRSFGDSPIRSMYIFKADELPKSFVDGFSTKFRPLKVLDFEKAPLHNVPHNLGNLFLLKYLSLRNTNVYRLPKSIGKLLNLETLDLKQTPIRKIPREIIKLIKLRHLLVYCRNYSTKYCFTWERGAQMKNGIGRLTSLQKLYHVQLNQDGLNLIKELQSLRQLKKLGLKHVRREFGEALCASIDRMNHLESLNITAIAEDEVIDLDFISSPPQLRRLRLKGRLEKLPNWVGQLQCLVRLYIAYSKLKDDPLVSLKTLPNLLDLGIGYDAYDDECLHFQEGGFQKLKELKLTSLNGLNSIVIDNGALPVLKYCLIEAIPNLKEAPSGIHQLKNLEVLEFTDMPHEFIETIEPDVGQKYWIIKHVPYVYISQKDGPIYGVYNYRAIRH